MSEHQLSVESKAAALLIRLANVAEQQGNEAFLDILVADIADILQVATVLIGEISPDHKEVHVASMCHNSEVIKGVTYKLQATPCENVLSRQACFFPQKIQSLFPEDRMLSDIRAESYLGRPLFDRDGQIIGLIAVLDSKPMETDQVIGAIFKLFANQTANELIRIRMEQKLTHLAQNDSLTGWMERHHFYDLLEEELDLHNPNDYVLFFINIDNFRLINEAVGHLLGDQVLRQFSSRLRTVFQKEKVILCRYSGDEFAVFLKVTEETPAVGQLVDQLSSQIKMPMLIQDQISYITASIGISCYPQDASGGTLLVHRAEMAMKKAKERGKNNLVFFTEDIVDDRQRFSLKNELYEAITNRQFYLVYQPKWSWEGAVTGFEALVRWQHPTRGMIPPDEFIPLAEETGLINLLGDWVLKEACRQIREWNIAGIRDVTVAVNMSAVQFAKETILTDICAAVEEHHILYSSLIIEITEGMAMQNPDWTVSMINELQKRGIRVHLDDFGTGFSSLNYLSRFPVDAIKIDRSFVQNIGVDKRDTSIVNALLSIVSSLQLNVVAEGVETKEQAAYLIRHGCREMQGFYYSKPLPPKEAIAFCEN